VGKFDRDGIALMFLVTTSTAVADLADSVTRIGAGAVASSGPYASLRPLKLCERPQRVCGPGGLSGSYKNEQSGAGPSRAGRTGPLLVGLLRRPEP
jgi:hypothetical protein